MKNTFAEIEKLHRSYYPFAEDHWDYILSKIFDKRYYEYAGRRVWALEQLDDRRDRRIDINALESWKQSYNSIKDQSWPDCDTFTDFENLPVAIQNECINVHNFSPSNWLSQDIKFTEWQEDLNWTYQTFDLVRINYVILDNLEFIAGKKVVDFAGHVGLFAGCCLHNGAESVTYTNVKKQMLDIGNEVLELIDSSVNRHQSILSDIHDYECNGRICQGQDTVMLLGIMDIVHDHYRILESITVAEPNTIIIENIDPEPIKYNKEPLVYWWTEVTHTSWKGYHEDLKPITVGCPNCSWFDFVLAGLGYKKVKHTSYEIWEPDAQDLTNKMDLSTRSVHVYVKEL